MERIYRARVIREINGRPVICNTNYFTDKNKAEVYKANQSKIEKRRYPEFIEIEITQFIQWID